MKSIKTWLIVGLLIAVAAAVAYGNYRVTTIEKEHDQELTDLVSMFGDSVKHVQTEFGQVSERYLVAVNDLDDALKDNTRLHGRLRSAENRLNLKVEQIEELVVVIETLELEGQGLVVTDSIGTGGFVEVVEDTAGIHIKGRVYWPSGKTSFVVKRDPINFIITLQTNKSGKIAKKTIEFPDQPWMSVDTWEVALLAPDKERKGFLSGLLPSFGHLDLLAGVSAGSGIGGDVGATMGNWSVLASFTTEGNNYHILRTIRIW